MNELLSGNLRLPPRSADKYTYKTLNINAGANSDVLNYTIPKNKILYVKAVLVSVFNNSTKIYYQLLFGGVTKYQVDSYLTVPLIDNFPYPTLFLGNGVDNFVFKINNASPSNQNFTGVIWAWEE